MQIEKTVDLAYTFYTVGHAPAMPAARFFRAAVVIPCRRFLSMQNRYTGDIGDFGKLGILRQLNQAGLSVGVNWYLTPDETHNGDGRHIEYLQKRDFSNCDETLWCALKQIVNSGLRQVSALESSGLLQARYYSKPLDFTGISKPMREAIR